MQNKRGYNNTDWEYLADRNEKAEDVTVWPYNLRDRNINKGIDKRRAGRNVWTKIDPSTGSNDSPGDVATSRITDRKMMRRLQRDPADYKDSLLKGMLKQELNKRLPGMTEDQYYSMPEHNQYSYGRKVWDSNLQRKEDERSIKSTDKYARRNAMKEGIRGPIRRKNEGWDN